MNSDHAPTAEEQLPPLDTSFDVQLAGESLFYQRKFGNKPLRVDLCGEIICRERQLLAALRENREKDARIAELEQRCNTFMQGLEDEEKDCEALHTKLEAAEAKLESVREMVAYYTEDDDSLLARIRAIVEPAE